MMDVRYISPEFVTRREGHHFLPALPDNRLCCRPTFLLLRGEDARLGFWRLTFSVGDEDPMFDGCFCV